MARRSAFLLAVRRLPELRGTSRGLQVPRFIIGAIFGERAAVFGSIQAPSGPIGRTSFKVFDAIIAESLFADAAVKIVPVQLDRKGVEFAGLCSISRAVPLAYWPIKSLCTVCFVQRIAWSRRRAVWRSRSSCRGRFPSRSSTRRHTRPCTRCRRTPGPHCMSCRTRRSLRNAVGIAAAAAAVGQPGWHDVAHLPAEHTSPGLHAVPHARTASGVDPGGN